jgi:hypothetical protein
VSPPDDGRAEKSVTSGPPSPEAGGLLTVDLVATDYDGNGVPQEPEPPR